MGIFKRSFADISNAISIGGIRGGLNSLATGITQQDIININEYNRLVGVEGVSSQTAWNRTMLTSSSAAQSLFDNQENLVRSGRGLVLSQEAIANATQTMTIKAKAAEIGLKALSVAGNMLMMMGISMAISALFKGIDYLIHRTERMQEALQESVDKFKSVSDELKSLEEELKTTSERLEELQKLADNGTISVAEEAELENLKKTNKELARKIALKKQEKIDAAEETLKKAKKNADNELPSEYLTDNSVEGTRMASKIVTPGEELEAAIKEYEKFSDLMSNTDINNQNLYEIYESHRDDASARIKEMYGLISPTIDAYESLRDAGVQLEGKDKTLYKQLKKTQDAYLAYIYNVNGTKEAFESLNAEQQRSILLNRLVEQGLSKSVAKSVVDTIPNENLGDYWDKSFSFVPPEMKDGESAEEYGKRYAEAWAKGLEDGSKEAIKSTSLLTDLKTASEGISSISSAFKQLSDDGYMSTESMSKIQEATKLSGDEWLEYQNKLMNAKAGSAEFNQVMSDLTFRIIDNTFNLEELKNATDEECDAVEKQIAAVLRENGVTNANAVAHDYVRMARVDAAIAAYDGTQASYDSAAALIKESLSAEQAKRALAQLEIAKILVNNVKINTQSDIENIIALANAAGASAGALLRLQRAKTIIANGFNAKTPGNSGYVSVADMREMDNIQTQLSNNTFDFGFKPLNSSDFTVASYGSNPSSSGGGGSGSDKNDALDNYLKYIKHKKALGYYDDNAKQYINDLQYALDNLTKTEEEQWDLEEQIYSERENLKKEEISGYESWMSHLENLGYYEDDIAKKINDVTWALENQQLTEEEKFKKEEEIYKLTLERNKKIRESVENLAKAHSETYNSALSDVERYIEQLEHQKALTDDDETIRAIDKLIVGSMTNGITKAEDAISNLTTDANYWKGEIANKLKELGASFDISKWFDYDGSLMSQFESDMDELNNSQAEEIISSWANIVSEKLKGVADNTDLIFEYQEKIFSDSKEAIKESISDIQDAAEEIFNLRTSKLNSQSTLLKAQHSLINSIAETQHQLDKDILEAETSGARMSERERELLFTRDEYNKLSGKLNDVLSEANDIQDEFNRKLKGATLDTIDEITNHYERQYELKMKEYEIVKAELDVAKAQQKLENVENEKSVRQWDGEKWVYTSVLQDVINAQNELADAKYQLAQAEIEQSQTEAIQEIDAKVDSIETQKNLFIAALEELTEGTSSAREKLNTALNEIADTDISLFRNIIDRVGETLSGLGAVISSVSMGEPVNSSGAVKVVSGTGNGGIHPVDANKASLKNTYAKGSRYTSRGIGLFDEDGLGSEIIVTKDGVLRQFNAGETVFNSDMVQRLWDYASSNPIPWNYPNTNLSNISSLINKSQTTQPVYDNRTYFNGVEINDADGIRIMKEFSTYLKSKV